MDLNQHVGAEPARGHLELMRPEGGQKSLVQRYGRFGSRGVDEGGSPALLRVTIESELGNDQQGSTHLTKAQIHLPLGIGEEAQADHFVGHPIYLCSRVRVREAGEQTEATADGRGNLAFDRDGSVTDALQHDLHPTLPYPKLRDTEDTGYIEREM